MTHMRILLVCGNTELRRHITNMFCQQGCTVLVANNHRQAMEIGKREQDRLDGIITTLLNQDLGGVTLKQRMLRQKIRIPTVILAPDDERYQSVRTVVEMLPGAVWYSETKFLQELSSFCV